MRVRTALLLFAVALPAPGCGKSRTAGGDAAPAGAARRACETDQDCPARWLCLAGACADPSSKAVYTDPKNAVTADKVKKHVEQVNDQHDKAMDDVMKKADGEAAAGPR